MGSSNLENDLKGIVGDRVTTSAFERRHYTKEIVSIPKAVLALLRTMPAAVVKPETAEQVAAIVGYCRERGIPIVPRGAGSAGLFGSVPKKGGIVLDLMDLNRVLEVNLSGETAAALAGATWWQLEKELGRQGLTLMSYPSSARSATLGGWAMTSGKGIGTLKYGEVGTQILAAEIVLPDGSVREYALGADLDGFLKTEGILGVMTRLTLRVRRTPEEISHHLFYFANIEDLFRAATFLAHSVPVPFNLEFSDHRYLSLLRDSGYETGAFAPRSGTLLVTYDGGRDEVEAGRKLALEAVRAHHGVAREGAEHEWQQRFKMFRIRRAAPAMLPSSAVLPLGQMGRFYARLEKLRKRTIGLMGYVISAEECNLMPLIATDDLKFVEYVFAMHTPSEISRLALSLGGRPGGAVGVWNAAYRNEMLGEEKVAHIMKKKSDLDPAGIMNPGMWLEPPLIFRPGIYQLLMGAAAIADRFIPASAGAVMPEGWQKEMAACVQCGYCINYCPTKQVWSSATPRGRILMTKDVLAAGADQAISAEYKKSILQCTLCGRCRIDCSVDIASPEMWRGLRGRLAQTGWGIENLDAVGRTIGETYNLAAKANDRRLDWAKKVKLPFDLATKKRADVIYFVGCVTSFYPMIQPVGRAFVQIMDAAGVDFAAVGGDEWCCGFPLLAVGQNEAAEKLVRHNIEKLKETGARTIVMNCPGCYRVWKEWYHDAINIRHPFQVFHAAEYLAELIGQGKIAMKGWENLVTYHDPCDLGRNSGILAEPRYIIEKIPGLGFRELEDNREYCTCCGSGGGLLASDQELSLRIAGRKMQEVLRTGARTAVTACPACIRALNMAKTEAKETLEIMDITQLVWKAMGN